MSEDTTDPHCFCCCSYITQVVLMDAVESIDPGVVPMALDHLPGKNA
jgi:hypothetical protein